MSHDAEIARGIAVPLLRGPLRGMRWLPSSGGKLARFLLGSYEAKQSALFAELVRPGQQVLDLGAAAGYYTLLAAKCVGASGSVIACEPDAGNLRFLRACRAESADERARTAARTREPERQRALRAHAGKRPRATHGRRRERGRRAAARRLGGRTFIAAAAFED